MLIDLYFLAKYGLLVAVLAHVYCVVLIEPGKPLSWWYSFLNRLIGHDRKSEKPPIKILFDPLIDCVHCVTGQVALWTYLIFKIEHYNWHEHLLYVVVSIFITDAIQMIWKTMEATQRRKR